MALDKKIQDKLLEACFIKEEILEISSSKCQSKVLIKIKSKKFEGISELKKHRLVLSALGKEIVSSVHAISLELSC